MLNKLDAAESPSPMLHHNHYRPAHVRQAFTIVEALVAIVILMIFAVTSTMSLGLFNDRAARNRNTEAARAIVEDYVNCLLSDTGTVYTATAAGTDLDGDGTPDGVACTAIGSRTVPAKLPLIVTRSATPSFLVTGVLYWRVQAVGTTYGCAANTDLLQVNFLLQYTYRGQSFYYKAMTFKSNKF